MTLYTASVNWEWGLRSAELKVGFLAMWIAVVKVLQNVSHSSGCSQWSYSHWEITESHNGLSWKGPCSPSSSRPLPWAGLPPAGWGCPGPHSTRPREPPGMGHMHCTGKQCQGLSTLSVKNFCVTSILNLLLLWIYVSISVKYILII